MRKTSTLALTFEGLPVSIPVGMYKAVSEKDLKFNNLHKECDSQVKMKRYCPTCTPAGDGPELAADDLVKGYQISKGNFVKLEPSDFESIPLATLKEIHVLEFVSEDSLEGIVGEIDPRYFEESYFVAPEPASARIFSMMLQAADIKGAVAICKIVLREKEHMATLRPFQDGLFLLQTLYWTDELKDHTELKQPTVALSEKEMGMATKLIDMLMVETLDLSKYRDNYREKLTELVEKKAAGEVITPLVKAEAPAGDGMDALAAAIDLLAANKKTKAKV
jgi:DNA end-binding protein Ku